MAAGNMVKYYYDDDGNLIQPANMQEDVEYKYTLLEPIEIVNGIEKVLNFPLFNGEKWIENPNKKLPEVTPSDNQKLLMNLSQSITMLQSMIMAQNQQMAQLMTKEAK